MNELDAVNRDGLDRVARDLAHEFRGVFDPATVREQVYAAWARLPDAPVRQYLTIFAAKFAREILRSAAKRRGELRMDRPQILFVCVHNAGRSQMAAAFAETLGAGKVDVYSAGSAPASSIHPNVHLAMKEVGIDLSEAYPKPLVDDVVRASDAVITMGCGDACPVYSGKRYEDWQVADPAGQPMEVVRSVRDDIRARVERLLRDFLGSAR